MANSEQPQDTREQRLDEIVHRYYQLVEQGQQPEKEYFIAEHPEFENELREFLSDISNFRVVATTENDSALLPTQAFYSLPPAVAELERGPTLFGDFEILEKLGIGGMGVVYKAHQISLSRVVAIKLIRLGRFASEIAVARFQNEAKAAAKLQHPGIVAVHQVGVHLGQPYYTMDCVEGDNLAEKFRDQSIGHQDAATIVRQIAQAIHYAHAQGVIHRDLKPGNVILTKDGVAKVTDFGLAKLVATSGGPGQQDVTESGQIMGTAGYMSPEQAKGQSRSVGPETDIYSLGAILYALLAGRAPFVGESTSDTILQVINQDPVSPRLMNFSIPKDLETICLKCLQKEPSKRYASAAELEGDLINFLQHRPIKARPIGVIERGSKWIRRHRVVTAFLTLLSLSVSFGLCFSLYFAWAATAETTKTKNANTQLEIAERQARSLLSQTDSLLKSSQDQLYELSLATALNEWENGSAAEARNRLSQCPITCQGWEYHALAKLMHESSRVLASNEPARALASSPDGKRLAIAGFLVVNSKEAQYNVRMRDADSGELIFAIAGHSGNVNGIKFHPDGRLFATCGDDRLIKVWESDTGKLVATLSGHSMGITSLDFNSDGSQLVSCGTDGELRHWDFATHECIASWSYRLGQNIRVSSVKFSPSGKSFGSGAGDG